jgi:hypothetical protein
MENNIVFTVPLRGTVETAMSVEASWKWFTSRCTRNMFQLWKLCWCPSALWVDDCPSCWTLSACDVRNPLDSQAINLEPSLHGDGCLETADYSSSWGVLESCCVCFEGQIGSGEVRISFRIEIHRVVSSFSSYGSKQEVGKYDAWSVIWRRGGVCSCENRS